MIVLDTSVLSRALRRKQIDQESDPVAERLQNLFAENVPLAIPGIVAQEILSGVRLPQQFSLLQKRLEMFPLLLASASDHVEAARLVNRCRTKGTVISAIDALIAAITIGADGHLFTLDRDFARIAEVAPLKLLPVS